MSKKVIIDTDVLVDFGHNLAPWLDEVVDGRRKLLPVLPTIVISEYWASQRLSNLAVVRAAEDFLDMFRKCDFTEPIAKIMGEIMRDESYPAGAGTADLVVASTAIYLKAPLATRNTSHYRGIPNLQFFKP